MSPEGPAQSSNMPPFPLYTHPAQQTPSGQQGSCSGPCELLAFERGLERDMMKEEREGGIFFKDLCARRAGIRVLAQCPDARSWPAHHLFNL